MNFDVNPPRPEQVVVDTLPHLDVPQNEWPLHPILQRARLNILGDGLEWPSATFEQLPILRDIILVADDGVLCARLAAQFNFDRFVNANTDENAPAHPAGHLEDPQRFYTRVTENGFHVVGVFCAITLTGRRRYFQWLTGTWVEVGLSGFLYVRDDLDTHFSEVTSAQLDGPQPGASATPVTVEEEWTTETVRNQFLGEPMVGADSQSVAPAPAAVPVAEQLAASVALPAPSPATPQENAPQHLREMASDSPVAERLAGAMDSFGSIQRAIAIAIATVVHRDGLDFAGAAAIDHVARVAESFDMKTDPIRHCAAWLHDVLDVGTLTASDLRDAGVLPAIVDVVSLLTRPVDLDEDEWLDAISHHPDARAVKLRTVGDNSASWRLRRLDADTRARVEAARERARGKLGETS